MKELLKEGREKEKEFFASAFTVEKMDLHSYFWSGYFLEGF